MKNKWVIKTGVNFCEKAKKMAEWNVKRKTSSIHRRKRSSGLKKNCNGRWTIIEKWYSMMNQESDLAKVIMLELLFGAVQINHIKLTARRKE